MHFFIWAYIIDIVHVERVESFPDLCRRITAAIAAVPVDVFSRVWGEVEFSFDSVGPSMVFTFNCINGSRNWRDCQIVFVNKKFLCQNSE
jgi:hypothetical protein